MSQLYKELMGQLNSGSEIEMIDRYLRQILFLHTLIQKQPRKYNGKSVISPILASKAGVRNLFLSL